MQLSLALSCALLAISAQALPYNTLEGYLKKTHEGVEEVQKRQPCKMPRSLQCSRMQPLTPWRRQHPGGIPQKDARRGRSGREEGAVQYFGSANLYRRSGRYLSFCVQEGYLKKAHDGSVEEIEKREPYNTLEGYLKKDHSGAVEEARA
ncbi:hypothetical protein FIBSPDRAFT_898171 [Athelia psychrophila]|uniref:Uncharacterized protein n=1 Tax=Athelia psychrophila TaxID=1759441 RepID=A0A166B993_9AGAM|nr:hypothetical protein FIBSPDRAFT_898171 [Fibularhizoctonia sp. CBS 109695]